MHLNVLQLFKDFGWKYISDKMDVLEIGPNLIPSTYQQIFDEIHTG